MANWQQNEQLADITADLPRFSDALQRFTARLGLEIAGLDADHISLRCHQNTTAERWRRGLEQCGTLLSENMINGRPICLFKLAEPVCVAHWRFHIVELPWPGEKRYPHEGWEHIEIVLPGDPATLNARALALLAAFLGDLSPLITHRHPLAEWEQCFTKLRDQQGIKGLITIG